MKPLLVGIFGVISIGYAAIAQTSYTLSPEERKAIEEEIDQRKLLDAELFLEIPAEYKDRKGVFLVQESGSSRTAGETAYRFLNATTLPISYSGYSANSPLYRVQHLSDQKWKEIEIGWCGTGLGVSELPPGKSVLIHVLSEKLTGNFRVGIDIIGSENPSVTSLRTVWSSEK